MATNSRELRFFRGSQQHSHHSSCSSSSSSSSSQLLDFTSFDARTTSFFAAAASASVEVNTEHSCTTATTSTATATTTSTTTTTTSSTSSLLNSLLQQQRYLSSISNGENWKHEQPHLQPDHRALVKPPQKGYGLSIQLTEEERKLFDLLRHVKQETNLSTTLRVAGGWVRDKLLATPEFQAYHKVLGVGGKRLTSKFQLHSKNNPTQYHGHSTAAASTTTTTTSGVPSSSMGRQGTKILVSNSISSNADFGQYQQPVDIDIALDDMLGREFADHLNDYLRHHGEDTVSVGVVLKNPEKSKHLETATMKVESFWIDFVNLRAEEYTQTNSRIPDLMRIGTASEDAFRRDLTINALFFNINTGEVEDWTGRGFDDLRKGIVATPLPALTTLWDDPLRVLRAIRFAARLRFTMDQELIDATLDERVRVALAQKVSRERVGGEVDLMLRSPDPVGAMRLLVTLRLASTVFPLDQFLHESQDGGDTAAGAAAPSSKLFDQGLELLKTAHDHLADCKLQPPLWCLNKNRRCSADQEGELRLTEDSEARRLLWYAAFLKPLHDYSKRMTQQNRAPRRQGKKANRSLISRLLVDELKRPIRDAESIERIIKAADDFTQLLNSGCDISAMMILLSDVRVTHSMPSKKINGDNDHYHHEYGRVVCSMNGRLVDSAREEDPVWEHAMEFRLLCSSVLQRIGPLWRAAMILSISEQLAALVQDADNSGEGGLDYTIEGDVLEESQSEKRQGIVERFDAFATAMQHVGLIGIWNEKPLIDGDSIRNRILTKIPRGPAFREVMDEQMDWLIVHPGAGATALESHLQSVFKDYV